MSDGSWESVQQTSSPSRTKRSRLRGWATGLIEAILPTHCTICGVYIGDTQVNRAFCAACLGALPWWRHADGCPKCGDLTSTSTDLSSRIDAACPRCLANGSPLHRCHVLLRYEAHIRRWVPGFKNAPGVFGPSIPILRSLDSLVDALGHQLSHQLAGTLDLVTSIPIHPHRFRTRGFNQADWIATRLARRLALPFDPSCLRRTRHTQPQASLAGIARHRNVGGAFRARPMVERDLRIGLVDDVLTTGSTLEAAGNALLEAGAIEVRAIILAATLPPAARRPRRAAERPGCPYADNPQKRMPERTVEINLLRNTL